MEKQKPLLLSRERRLNHLYKIVDKNSQQVVFKLNKWQRILYDKENELYSLLIKEPDYVLINTKWSDGNTPINITKKSQVVYMDKIDGFTMLDWAKIIENAKEIHTVSTSNLFMIETLKLLTDDVSIYLRRPRENNFDGISEFVNRNFKLIV